MSTPSKFQISNHPGFVANLNSAEKEWATYNLTDFQMQHAVAIRARPDFAHWVTAGPIAASGPQRRQHKLTMCFYTECGTLHAHSVGLRKVLHTYTAESTEFLRSYPTEG